MFLRFDLQQIQQESKMNNSVHSSQRIKSSIKRKDSSNPGSIIELAFQKSNDIVSTYTDHMYGLFCLLVYFGETSHKMKAIEKINSCLQVLLEQYQPFSPLKEKVSLEFEDDAKAIERRRKRYTVQAMKFTIWELQQSIRQKNKFKLHNSAERNFLRQTFVTVVFKEKNISVPKHTNFSGFAIILGSLIDLDCQIVNQGNKKIIQYFSPEFEKQNNEVFVEYDKDEQECRYIKRMRQSGNKKVHKQFAEPEIIVLKNRFEEIDSQIVDLIEFQVSYTDEDLQLQQLQQQQFEQTIETTMLRLNGQQDDAPYEQSQVITKMSSIILTTKQTEKESYFKGFDPVDLPGVQKQYVQNAEPGQRKQLSSQLSNLFSVQLSEKQTKKILLFFQQIKTNIIEQKININWFLNEIKTIQQDDIREKYQRKSVILSQGEERLKQFKQILYQAKKQKSWSPESLRKIQDITYIIFYLMKWFQAASNEPQICSTSSQTDKEFNEQNPEGIPYTMTETSGGNSFINWMIQLGKNETGTPDIIVKTLGSTNFLNSFIRQKNNKIETPEIIEKTLKDQSFMNWMLQMGINQKKEGNQPANPEAIDLNNFVQGRFDTELKSQTKIEWKHILGCSYKLHKSTLNSNSNSERNQIKLNWYK